MSAQLDDAYRWCRALTYRHYENFPVVSALVERRLRPHFWALYAYARTVDDLGDEYPGDRLAALDAFEADLRRAWAGRPEGPLFIAVADTMRRCRLPLDPFLALIEANRRDQRSPGFATFADLLDYCRYSANPVGRLVLALYDIRGEPEVGWSDATCTALQIVNFLQDIGEDAERGRCYLPAAELAACGVRPDSVLRREMSLGLAAVVRELAERAHDLFIQGSALEGRVPRRLGWQLRLYRVGGEAILRTVRRSQYNPFVEAPRLSRAAKAGLALRVLVGGGAARPW
jgi:squalene synthase HpnC